MSINPLALESKTEFFTLESQQSNLMYYIDNADGSGYVFELGELDVSQAIATDPSFAAFVENIVGLPSVDAVAQMDVSLVQFQGLFGINIDSSDIDDVSGNDVLFRVNQPQDQTHNDCSSGTGSFQVGSFFDGSANVAFSDADLKSGHVNAAYPASQKIKHDFVRHLAKQITGGYSSSDIFTNETPLRNAVVATDSQLNATINAVISDVSGLGLQNSTYQSGPGSSLIQAARQLYNLNLQVTDGSGNSSRSDQLLSDISLASANMEGTTVTDLSHNEVSLENLDVPLRFHSGDRLAVRLVYKPNSTTFAGNGATLSERSYKVLLRLV